MKSTPSLLPPAMQRRRPVFAPLEPVSPRARWMLGVGFFVLFVMVWAAFTLSGYISPTFLASPVTMVREGWLLFTQYNFHEDIGMTVWRVFGGFAMAAIVAVPLGIAMGAYKPVEAFLEPFVSFCRYLPASAFIPLLILWAGLGEAQKLLVIFIGSVFQIILMVAVIVGGARRDLVEAAYTLGASSQGIVKRVLIPGAAPGIAETLVWVNALFQMRHNSLPEDMSAVLGTLGCLLKTREDRFVMGHDRLRQLVEGRRSVGVAENANEQAKVAA